MTTHKIENATIHWQNNQPKSTAFDDIYFSVEDGIAETRHVFIEGNHLTERFSTLNNSPFTIAETGFGTGLNFLCARLAFLQSNPSDKCLHFISCEKYPLNLDDLTKALSPITNLAGFTLGCEQLIEQWPLPISGCHKLTFDNGRVSLWLLFGDATEQLQQLDTPIDAWFLDGFSPAKNPEMWHAGLFEQVARLSHNTTTLATFSAAGIVKRGLTDVGFNLKKVAGFGRKRDMLQASYSEEFTPKLTSQPWLARPPQPAVKRTAIIGAGLAGATLAHTLAERGIQVTVYDRNTKPAQGASGNSQGALYAKLPAKPINASRIHLNGLQYTINLIKRLKLNNDQDAALCGVMQLADNQKEQQLQHKLIAAKYYSEQLVEAVSAQRASDIIGTYTPHEGLFFPNAGWVSPPRLISHLLSHANITVHTATPVTEINQSTQGWHVNRSAPYDTLTLCSGYEIGLLKDITSIDLKPIRGQVSLCDSKALPQLNTVVCAGGYIAPALEEHYCFGSSFLLNNTDTYITESEHQHNLNLLGQALPQFVQKLDIPTFKGRASSRAATRDYLPLVGGICDKNTLIKQYERLRKDAHHPFTDTAPWCKGLYINVGHGSKGLITCPLSAEIIAAQMLCHPYPLEQTLINTLSPQRFIVRDLIRGRI